ncbi:MAG: hypothetical protein RIG61_02045 [Deltaproteobacteria bacterium]
MLRKNIPGAVLIVLVVLSFVGVGLYLGISLNWPAYFKVLAIVAVIALIISAIINTVPSGKNTNS